MHVLESPYKGSGTLTREQFLFYETRITARLMMDGLDRDEIVARITEETLFQFPTEKMCRRMAQTCIARLEALGNEELVAAIASQPSDIAKQICLYAMMKQYRLVWDFMITVIGEKYRKLDMSYGKIDLNTFFLRLQEQDDVVSGWSEQTVYKLKQVLQKILVENEYLDSTKADHINPVLICSILENAIRADGQEVALPAFNCLA